MKKANPRDLALMVLQQVGRQGFFLDDQLNRLFSGHPDLDPRDKAFISQLVHGTLRWRLRLDWLIEHASETPIKKIHPLVLNILRLACFQIFFLDKVPESAAVNQAVQQVKRKKLLHVVSFVNGLLRNLCRSKSGICFPDPSQNPIHYLSVFYSYPEWLVEKWIREKGPQVCESLLEAGNRLPKTSIRVNSLKTSRDNLIKQLTQEGLPVSPTLFSPLGITLHDFKGRVTDLTSFKTGCFQVQDEAAQISAYLLDPQAHERILDICAGLGGKSTLMAQLMNDQGLIIALDSDQRKLQVLLENTRRLGIQSVYPLRADATQNHDFLFSSLFDKILVDAPCSGLGVIARHPDAKWNRCEEDLLRLADLQKRILEPASRLLRRGGRLLYVTCTHSREENEEVVELFLRNHPHYALLDLRQTAPPWAKDVLNERGFFRTFYHVHGMDGFFGALLERRMD